MTFQLLCGRLPFGSDKDEEYFNNSKACNFSFSQEDEELVSAEARDFIEKNLRPYLPEDKEDQDKTRLDFEQFCKHPFIAGNVVCQEKIEIEQQEEPNKKEEEPEKQEIK